ncbi:MAG: AAA family ATPase [Trichodesmium sp. MAG_R01]|nr:AAA family ATPase [Trichodesmium sp. MAG_R01]
MYDLFAIIAQNTNISQSMDIKEVLKLVEELIYDHTGENLDYLQKTILQRTLEGQTYKKISEETYASETHVRYIGAKLWKTLSEILGENITKANFRTILENANIYNFAIGKNSRTNNINICPSNPHASPIKTNSQQTPTQHIIDLDKAPEIINFYGRTEEISTMTKWIVSDRLRVISLLGISGIGKTTLSLRLIQQINGLENQTPTFNYIIYRTLRFSPTLTTTLANLLQTFAPETEVSDNIEILLSQLQKYLVKYPCCIIFDDVQKLFTPGKLAGQYKSGYANYRDFFQLFATVSHQSCLLLISREKIAEILKLETENYPVETLILGSLGAAAKEICQKHQLVNQESWEKLINNYQGNPQWLDITATIIKELFSGKVAEFMEYKTLILPEALQAELEQQLQHLSPLEIRIMKQIANQVQPISIAEIIRQSQLSIQENINLIQSLKKRLLLYGQLENNLTVFTLNSIWNQYLKNKN